jgi:hypothetical protein
MAAYRDPTIQIRPTAVSIDKNVWELLKVWRKQDPSLGRTLEIVVRCAVIIASIDQRKTIYAKDIEAIRPFLDYQMRCRQLITPNPGITNDAKMTNAVLGWLNRHASKCEWVNQRDVKRGLDSQITTLGLWVYSGALKNLEFTGAIESYDKPNAGTRASKLIRLTESQGTKQ